MSEVNCHCLKDVLTLCFAIGHCTHILDVAEICGKNRKYPLFCEIHPAYRTTGTGVGDEISPSSENLIQDDENSNQGTITLYAFL